LGEQFNKYQNYVAKVLINNQHSPIINFISPFFFIKILKVLGGYALNRLYLNLQRTEKGIECIQTEIRKKAWLNPNLNKPGPH